jgi:hypothetical protein
VYTASKRRRVKENGCCKARLSEDESGGTAAGAQASRVDPKVRHVPGTESQTEPLKRLREVGERPETEERAASTCCRDSESFLCVPSPRRIDWQVNDMASTPQTAPCAVPYRNYTSPAHTRTPLQHVLFACLWGYDATS